MGEILTGKKKKIRMSLNVLVCEKGLKARLRSVVSAILNCNGWKNVCGHVGFRRKKNKKKIYGVVDNSYQTIFFEMTTESESGWPETFIQRWLQTNKQKVTRKKMCLLMFACLPVYLFIRLFIIWKWLYKLSMNMLLPIQIILFYINWFCFLFFL